MKPVCPQVLIGTNYAWIWQAPFGKPPLEFMINRHRLNKSPMDPARNDWALDSGGFTELKQHGKWTINEEQYLEIVARFADECGRMLWAAQQDWMCEPFMLDRTGLTVADHQQRTVENFVMLRAMAPDLPIIPVIQGWTPDEYLRCIKLYEIAGVDLTSEKLVGVGSICRRKAVPAIAEVVVAISEAGIERLHGFGLTSEAVRYLWPYFTSIDSTAWVVNHKFDLHVRNESDARAQAMLWRRNVEKSLRGVVYARRDGKVRLVPTW